MANICLSQHIDEVYFPTNNKAIQVQQIDRDTGESIDTNYVSEINDGHKSIYINITRNDTINEFFHYNDSTYFFQQRYKDETYSTGYFKVYNRYDTIVKWRLGVYEEQLVVLPPTKSLRKTGVWKYKFENETMYMYSDGHLKSIINPTTKHILEYHNWLNADKENIYIKKRYKPCNAESNCYSLGDSMLGEIVSNSLLSTRDNRILVKFNNEIMKFEIYKIGKEGIILVKETSR